MIAARQDHVPLRESPGNANVAEVCVFTRLHKTNHLRIRDNFVKLLCELKLQRAGHAEEDTFLHLLTYGVVHFIITVPQRHRSKREAKVDVLFALHVPNAAALAPVNEFWHRALELRIRALGVRLRSPRNELQSLFKMLV